MNKEIKYNGFELDKSVITTMDKLESYLNIMFEEFTIDYFVTSQKFTFATVSLPNDSYAHYHISVNSIRLNGYSCNTGEFNTFAGGTLNDELYTSFIK